MGTGPGGFFHRRASTPRPGACRNPLPPTHPGEPSQPVSDRRRRGRVPRIIVVGRGPGPLLPPRGGGGLKPQGCWGAGAAHWADQLFISSTLTSEVPSGSPGGLGRFRRGTVLPSSRPAAIPLRFGVGLAGLLLLAGPVWLSGLIIWALQRQVWLGDHARFQARPWWSPNGQSASRSCPSTRVPWTTTPAADQNAPPGRRATPNFAVGKLCEEVHRILSDQQAEPLRALAHQAYLAALEEEPRSPTAWVSLARFLALDPASRHQALVMVDQALALDPRNPNYLDLKARILLDLGRPREALANWQTALAIRPDLPRLLLGKAESLLLLKHDRQAKRALTEP